MIDSVITSTAGRAGSREGASIERHQAFSYNKGTLSVILTFVVVRPPSRAVNAAVMSLGCSSLKFESLVKSM